MLAASQNVGGHYDDGNQNFMQEIVGEWWHGIAVVYKHFLFFFFTRDVINDGIINAHFREKQNASFRSNDLFFRSMPLA